MNIALVSIEINVVCPVSIYGNVSASAQDQCRSHICGAFGRSECQTVFSIGSARSSLKRKELFAVTKYPNANVAAAAKSDTPIAAER